MELGDGIDDSVDRSSENADLELGDGDELEDLMLHTNCEDPMELLADAVKHSLFSFVHSPSILPTFISPIPVMLSDMEKKGMLGKGKRGMSKRKH